MWRKVRETWNKKKKKKIDKKRKNIHEPNAFPVMIDYDISRVRVFDIIYPPRPPRVHTRPYPGFIFSR